MPFFRQDSGRSWSALASKIFFILVKLLCLVEDEEKPGRKTFWWYTHFFVWFGFWFVLGFGLFFVWGFFEDWCHYRNLFFRISSKQSSLKPWVYTIVNKALYFAFHHSHSSPKPFYKSCNELCQFGEPLKSRKYVSPFISLLKWIWVQLVNSIWLCSELQSSPAPLALGPPALWAVKAEAGMQQQPESHCTTDLALSVKDVKPNATSDSWELPETKDHLAQTSLLLGLNSPKIISPRILLVLSWFSQLYEKQFLCFHTYCRLQKRLHCVFHFLCSRFESKNS